MKNTCTFEQEPGKYHFYLPETLIANEPSQKRDLARLLLVRSNWKNDNNPKIEISHHLIKDLPALLNKNDLLILNRTRVSHRRVYLKRKSGAIIEALFLKQSRKNHSQWYCLIRGKKKLNQFERLLHAKEEKLPLEFEYRITDKLDANGANSIIHVVKKGQDQGGWETEIDAENFFSQYGELPLPPYIGRKPQKNDNTRYQTIFADESGSIAAPTAGLHFTKNLIFNLEQKQILINSILLHIGYGTFAPLREENWKLTQLHSETYSLSKNITEQLNTRNNRIIAVGTTTLRALESNWRLNNRKKFTNGRFSTSIFLKPPDEPSCIDGLLTNFHLPESSLLILIASMLGRKNTLQIYNEAISKEYRFYSYGDAMLILP